MHGSLTFTRSFIPWCLTGRFELAIDTPAVGLGPFVDRIVREILPPEALQGEPITDRKGRDSNQLLVPTVPTAHLPHGEELFFVTGRTPSPEEPLVDITPDTLTEPFSIAITTSFDRFIGDHHIVHRTHLARHGAAVEAFAPRDVGQAWPLVIDRFRIGIQLFRSRYVLVFGYTPTVERTLLIDADTKRIHIAFEIERLTARAIEPFLADDLFRNIADIIRATTGESCEPLLRARLPQ